ncbi:MAG TPA: S41 family peptidase [Chthoniobacterales bacterium]|nr:S41 family peptidase [Chthoniobacterales bacterium]
MAQAFVRQTTNCRSPELRVRSAAKLISICFLVVSGLVSLHAQSPTPTAALRTIPEREQTNPATKSLVDQLGPTQFQEVLSRLRSAYVDPNAVNAQALDQAALIELLSRLGPGVRLRPRSEVEKPTTDHPFRGEILNDRFGYIRCGTLNQNTLVKLDDALGTFRNQNIKGIIVDLRTTPESTDYHLAGEFISRFVPKGTLAYRIVGTKPNQERSFSTLLDPLYQGPLALVVDQGTAGAAEIIAASLRAKAHGLLIGERTSGSAAEYQSSPIGNNLLLTIAVTQVQVPDYPAIFPTGLQPDILVSQPTDQERSVLAETDNQSSEPFITDEPRQHLNEAALVAGTNPELDSYVAQQSGQTQPAKLKDPMLQRAVDFLITVNLYKSR